MLLLTLRGHYLKRESDYIVSNAAAIGSELSLVVQHDMEAGTLQSYVGALAFLAQARVRFLGPDGAALADSGYPQGLTGVASLSLDLQLDGMSRVFTQTRSGGEGEQSSQIAFEAGSADSPTGRTRVAQPVVVTGGQPADASGAAVSGPGPGLGFDLGTAPETPRSSKVVTVPVPVRDPLAGLLYYA